MRHISGIGLPLATLFLVTIAYGVRPQAKAAPDAAAPAFDQFVVTIEPFGMSVFAQVEELRIDGSGTCQYKVAKRKANPQRRITARPPAVIQHQLASSRIRQLNKLLKKTNWLTAEGAEGTATHTHPTTVKITLKRSDEERSVVCHGRRPDPYKALLHALRGLAIQERRIYLHDYARGEAGERAWGNIGREIAALRGDPYGKSPFKIHYERYLPIATRIVRRFYGETDAELIPAVRLVGHFRVNSELEFLHRMAHDRISNNLRREVAWALGRIHNSKSLPVLVSMMSAPANQDAAGLQLIQWGDEAIPRITKLIRMSTNDKLPRRKNRIGEDMIRTYLKHWDKLDRPIDPRVVAAVREALERKDPDNGLITTEYHKQFLKRAE